MHESVAARFWAKVDSSAGPNACWSWTGCNQGKGYGQLYMDGRMQQAHRISLMLAGVDVPDDRFVLHKCDNRICVNPLHTFERACRAARMHERIVIAVRRQERGGDGVTHDEALAWLRGERHSSNMVPQYPHETWMVRISEADAAMTQQAYWIAKAHAEGLVSDGVDGAGEVGA